MNRKNLLITHCILFFTVSSLWAQTAGVPIEEYNSLKELYGNSVGSGWFNNTYWLDTTNHSVADWYGITVENRHVTKIELPSNNLQGNIFPNRMNWPELEVLDISSNSIEYADFNSLDSLLKLKILKLESNKLIFKCIQPVFGRPQYEQLAAGFSYSPQAKISFPQNVEVSLNQNYLFSVSEFYISPNDQLQWYKDGIKLEGETGSTIEFLPATKADSGSYWLQITNPAVPGLTLYSHYKTLLVENLLGAGVPISEYNALVDFYNSMDGENWTKNDNWLDTVNCSVDEWLGITVRNGHVTEIYFGPYYNYNLNGSIPNSIKNLTQLESLIIVTDNVSGELPAGLFELMNLKTLCLGECKISGSVPAEIGNLTKLENLGLEANKLEGVLPPEIGNLANLKFLTFFENNLSGEIPSSLGQLTKLEYLALSYNHLTGPIPATIGNLTNLKWLLLNNNELTGPLPVELALLTNALKISLDNNLIGEIQDSLKTQTIKSANNENHRQIPDELAGLLQMDTLYLGGNKLQFNDIEAIFSWGNYNEFRDFIYVPQDSVGTNSVILKNENDNVTLSISNYFPGPSDKYQWYKNGVEIPGAHSAFFSLNSVQASDAGRYVCEISNPVATELTLYSKTTTLAVSEAVGTGDRPVVLFDIYPNPAETRIFIDLQNRTGDLEVYNFAGKRVLFERDFESQWLDVSHFSKGVYLFKIKDKNLEVVAKAIVIR